MSMSTETDISIQKTAKKSKNSLEKLETSKLIELEERGLTKILWCASRGPQLDAYTSKADEILYGGAAGGGKALALDTPLPTPSGWTTMGEVQVGDELFDIDGKPCKVTATSKVFENHRCYDVAFSDGSVIRADAEHKWVTTTISERSANRRRTEEYRNKRREARKTRGAGKRPDLAKANRERDYTLLEPTSGSVKTTQEIYNSVQVRGRTNHAIAVCKPLELPEEKLPIHPYVFGAWLVDGSSYKAEITSADSEVLEAVEEHYRMIGRTDITYGIYGLLADLRAMGLIANKHIPIAYLRSSVAQRLALLHGLMDTDGTCGKNGHCTFTTTNKVLADGMQELLATLGIKARICEGRAKLYGKDCGPKYNIKFLTQLPAFMLPRKLNRQKRSGFRGTHEYRYITSVTPADSVTVKCVAVDSPSRLYLAGTAMIPTHNTDLLIGLAVTQHERSIIFRREFPQLRAIEDRSHEILDRTDATCNHSLHIWRDIPGGRTLEFGAVEHEKDVEKYQGRPHDFIGFDELTQFSEKQYLFLRAWLRTTNPEQRCCTVGATNPPTSPEGGWVLRRWAAWLDPAHQNRAMPGELRWYVRVNDEELEVPNGDPFEHDGEMLSPQSRTFVPAFLADNPYLAGSGYRSTLESLPEPLRSILRDGRWDLAQEDDPWQICPTSWVMNALYEPTSDTSFDMQTGQGCDVSRGGKAQTVIAKLHNNKVAPLIKYPGKAVVDGATIARWNLDAVDRTDVRIGIDNTGGWGTSPYDKLRESQCKNPIVGVVFSAGATKETDRTGTLKLKNLRTEMFWDLRDAIDPAKNIDAEGNYTGLQLPNDPQLIGDLTAVKWSLVKGGIAAEPKEDIEKRLKRSTDCGDAVAIAYHVRRKAGFDLSTAFKMGSQMGLNKRATAGLYTGEEVL